MTQRLQGRTVLITGGARGQGASEAAMFAEAGAHVLVGDVLDEEGVRTAREVGGDFFHLDVTSPSDWSAVADTIRADHGRLDVLVNNAGVAPSKPGGFHEITVEEHLRLFDVNVHGVFHGVRATLELLRAGHGASVVNISSIDGLAGVSAMASYVASKHALTGLTRSLALELGPEGIRVNSIHPGVIDTPMVSTVSQARRDRLTRTVGRQPIRRMGRPEEVAAMALFLASDEASYCTGAQFVVDGGHLAGPYREPAV
ncbi:glucose 1-dehydrogenase [Streptomyces sp. NPDC050264]|uniref:SDR family NAD(P)-dependent oxidoreductase n=1 Tax=Streptomyces sp. NPDC050264 TaxID=3155038 RepID=UPI00341DDD01